ncbi:class I adenylate-forming enzyme family protein [Rhodococcus sp. T2V]|uniref:class I adenylate-forming enzyme family protein n=1 Tax=Rhodococcus sp. T2V TaxID=3034164 RepID=UPI0023E0E08B|nr:class I adenylate-forming enzyme family protein [Rhodococcus sp. T2V]MDF3306455.1 class I adenylate-forming enzyme family protein [Rhodococcus sp. T2V]
MTHDATLVDFIRLNERRVPDRDAVVDDNDRLTHRQLSNRAWALARGLRAAGIQPGDHVGILAGNSIFTAEAFLGTIAAGAVAVMYNWRWATAELAHGISSTDAQIILVEDEFAAALDAASATGQAGDFRAYKQGPEYDSLLIDGEPVDPVIGLEDPMCILFTGGTTGFSKGVVLPHRSAIFNAANEIIDTGMAREPENVALNLTPLFHSAALLCLFIPHYISGGTNVILRRFDERQVAEFVEKERITTSFMIPNMIRRLIRTGALDHPGFQNFFRQMHTGGGLLRWPDKEAVTTALPDVRLFFRYGLTEAGAMVARALPEAVMDPALDGTVGREYTFAEVKIVDFDGAEVGPGELGEICVRGPAVMLGYYNKPQETADTLVDGWLHTGDLAVRDQDGNIFFRDRAKDMIKSGGENVYAAEIEQQLYSHPAVMECGVLGVPSTEWDEEVRAVVALRPGRTASEQELKDYLRQHLAGYKVPKLIIFLSPDEMPVNPSGKIVKSNLRQIVKW